MTDRVDFGYVSEEYERERARLEREMERALAPLLARKREVAGKLIRSEVDDFFRDYPQLESFSWTQHSQHYNDEEYYWEVDLDPEQIKINGVDYYDTRDWLSDAREPHNYRKGRYVPKPEHAGIFALYEQVSARLGRFEDDMEELFGDFARVTITRDGCTVEHWGN